MSFQEISAGKRVRIFPFAELAEVYRVEQRGGQIILGVIFQESKKAETFILEPQELASRVSVVPSLAEEFASGRFLPRELFLLFAEGLRMRLAYTFDPHYAVSVTQVDLLPHQVDGVYRHILPQPRIRFLLADDPGLGKTIMAGLVLKELKARGLVRDTLAVVPAHLQDQWRREMYDWFREDFTLLDRSLLQSIYSDEFFQRNPQLITSMDFAKREGVKEQLARRRWDLVIVDEAHKLSATKYGMKPRKTHRYQLGEALSPQTNNLLFLTATPHKGDDAAFFMLIDLLEPRLFASERYLREAAKRNGLPFVLRRTKEQVTKLNGEKLFKRREVRTLTVKLTDAEDELYKAVTAYVQRWYARVGGAMDKRSRNIVLALTVLQRRMASGLVAIRESLRRRKSKLSELLDRWELALEREEDLPELSDEEAAEEADSTDAERARVEERREGLTAARTPEELKQELGEIDKLIHLALQAEKAGEEAKVRELRTLAENRLRGNQDEKLLVFTEFKDTLIALQRKFRDWGYDVATIHGDVSLPERIEQERYFRDQAQVMVGTDAAGEGINLQFCRLMVNYDLPWNPNRLEQRMGRIHRYGQKRECFVFNMLYGGTVEGNVLHKLLDKLEQMRERLGSDAVYDVVGTLMEGVRLEELVMQAVLRGDSTEVEAVIETNAEETFEHYRRALEEHALAGHHIDLSAVARDEVDSKLMRLVPWDVERFTRMGLQVIGGSLSPDVRKAGVFRLAVPREFARSHTLPDSHVRGLRAAFEREAARRHDAEFFAPGHALLEAMVDHFLAGRERPVRVVLASEEGMAGSLWLFHARIADGTGRPVLERMVALLSDRHGNKVRHVDPRMVWGLEGVEPSITVAGDYAKALGEEERIAREEVTRIVQAILQEAKERRSREAAIKRRWLTESYDALVAESNRKLLDYTRREERGEDVRLAKQQEEENLKGLVREKDERLAELEREKDVTSREPELEAVVLVVPKAVVVAGKGVEEAKRRVELAGMAAAMDHEHREGRVPVDVSQEFLGYDVLSQGDGETRYIEVKSFEATGELQLTPHEWQIAQRLGDVYWLYVVENALSQSHLHTIKNPAKRFLEQAQEVIGLVKVLIPQWKGA